MQPPLGQWHTVRGSPLILQQRMCSQFLNVDPYPFSVQTQMSLWDATQRLVNSFKDVAGGALRRYKSGGGSFVPSPGNRSFPLTPFTLLHLVAAAS